MKHEINAAGAVICACTMQKVPRGGVVFAISHNERTELLEAKYLLPQEHRLGNRVFIGDGKEREIVELQRERERNMSPQALRNPNSQVFMEFVGTLPRIQKGDDVQEYLRTCQERIQKIVDYYESNEGATYKTKKGKVFQKNPGITCLHASIHLDEGSINKLTGEVQYNAHYHLVFDRLTPQGIMWKPGPAGLTELQDIAAEFLEMPRGTTYEERGNKKSRGHIKPEDYRQIAEEFNSELNAEKVKTADVVARVEQLQRENAALALKADLAKKSLEQMGDYYDSAKREISTLKQKNAALESERDGLGAELKTIKKAAKKAPKNEAYSSFRAFLKGSGVAEQRDYQTLKEWNAAGVDFEALADVIERERIDELKTALRGTLGRQLDYGQPVGPAALWAAEQLLEGRTIELQKYEKDADEHLRGQQRGGGGSDGPSR